MTIVRSYLSNNLGYVQVKGEMLYKEFEKILVPFISLIIKKCSAEIIHNMVVFTRLSQRPWRFHVWRDIKIVNHSSTFSGQYMKGIDILDGLIWRYKIKMKKWYMRLFHHLLDIILVNKWILYKNTKGRKAIVTGRLPFVYAILKMVEWKKEEDFCWKETSRKKRSATTSDLKTFISMDNLTYQYMTKTPIIAKC